MGLAALVLGVLIAQIAVAGGSKDGKVASLERDNQSLQRRVSALEARVGSGAKAAKKKNKRGPAGPQGPAGSPGQQGVQGQQGPAGAAPACQGNGSGDAMVAAGAVCIDRYEASIWTAAEGGTQITGALPCNANGQDCKAGTAGEIYARSVPGVTPRVDITWFQAQQALANSGKRLPSNAEWQQAVAGTPDPGTDNGTTNCNVFSTFAVANTGSRSLCVSNFGANDMVGNLWEWVADWDEQASGCTNWPAGFGTDVTCLGRGSGEASTRFPGALFRGGDFSDTTNAGPFAVNGFNLPSGSGVSIGFRGAR